jgi:predicted amidohydrolase YtcJ
VTQPGFIAARGDAYATDVDPEDRPFLYPCGSLLERGIAVGGSTDAPFGPEDPWRAIATAASRKTSSGQVLGADERVDARRALALFLTEPGAPGGAERRVVPDGRADLCLLRAPISEALRAPSRSVVAATMYCGGLTFVAPS